MLIQSYVKLCFCPEEDQDQSFQVRRNLGVLIPMPMPSDSHGQPGVETNLHDLAQLLRQAEHLGPKTQMALAQILEELAQAMHSAPVPSQELIPLAHSTADLVHALHQKEDTQISSTQARLRRSILQIENQSPFVAQLAERLLDTLASSGI
jgi:hypothetical protein